MGNILLRKKFNKKLKAPIVYICINIYSPFFFFFWVHVAQKIISKETVLEMIPNLN